MADSRIEDQITAIINGEPYSKELYSRVEAILQSMIDNTPYDLPTYSRLEDLLLEWKETSVSGDISVEGLSVTDNGTYTAPSGTAYSPVTVNVSDIPAVIESITITENGTYTAPSGVDGYSPVIVNVSPSLPDTYEPLEYVTLNGYTGFVMLNYALLSGDIVEAYTAPFAESLSGEHAFFAAPGYIEGCYQDGSLTKWGSGCVDLIGSRPATANTKYLSRIQMTYANADFTIGYYNDSVIYFFGKIYSLTIIRPTKDQSGTEVGSVKLLDFVPAKRKSDNKVGLYDMVNQVFCVSTTGTDFGEPT